MGVQFEWDGRKAEANVRKHGISFDEASTVFDDPLALVLADEEHSDDEVREIIVGHSVLQRLLLVSFTERDEDVIRIISCRKADKRERKHYEENA